ncbi:MAG: AMP-binding protein [Thermoproteota archaeon]|nr:AMP-binding protein [Thermoproteota archaeon]
MLVVLEIINNQDPANIYGQRSSDSNVLHFMKKLRITSYQQLIQKSNKDTEWYWHAVNRDLNLKWFRKYDRLVDQSHGISNTKWFTGGKCNIIANAIDRHVKSQPNKIAYIFENAKGATRKVSYKELAYEVNLLSCALKDAGIKKGDTVGIYMPLIPEALFAIFACSKIGAIHTTIFSGFNAQALHSRLNDAGAKMLITANKMQRRSVSIDLRKQWLPLLKSTDISKIIVVEKKEELEKNESVEFGVNNKVFSYEKFVRNSRLRGKYCKTEPMDSEDSLFILYTSGTTGKPKGTIQTHGGFMIVAAQQTAYLIDMKANDVLFWYADIGWITGQTWVVYGSSIIGGTALVYDDALDYPELDTWCKLISKHNVTIFGVAPTAIRLFIKNNTKLDNYDLTSLRVLATTGEVINKEAWIWYFENVGKKQCPIINLSGGTEIGGAIISCIPSMPLKPCTVGFPVPGFDADIFDDEGKSAKQGYLVIKKPWPSMTRGILKDHERFNELYWSKYKNVWYHGDIVSIDSDGLWYILGRADDVIKVSGHRIGSVEIEAAITAHPAVAEAMAIGVPDRLKGQSIVAHVILKKEYENCAKNREGIFRLRREIMQCIENSIGKFACPKEIKLVYDLPRTPTGKTIRKIIVEKGKPE